MPHYKAYVSFNAAQSGAQDTITITLEANNAIEAKALLQDRYGEGAVQSIKRQDQARQGAGRTKVKATSPKIAEIPTHDITSTESHERMKARA